MVGAAMQTQIRKTLRTEVGVRERQRRQWLRGVDHRVVASRAIGLAVQDGRGLREGLVVVVGWSTRLRGGERVVEEGFLIDGERVARRQGFLRGGESGAEGGFLREGEMVARERVAREEGFLRKGKRVAQGKRFLVDGEGVAREEGFLSEGKITVHRRGRLSESRAALCLKRYLRNGLGTIFWSECLREGSILVHGGGPLEEPAVVGQGRLGRGMVLLRRSHDRILLWSTAVGFLLMAMGVAVFATGDGMVAHYTGVGVAGAAQNAGMAGHGAPIKGKRFSEKGKATGRYWLGDSFMVAMKRMIIYREEPR